MKNIFLFLIILLFILGQIFIIQSQFILGITLTFFALIIIFIIFLDKTENINIKKIDFSFVLIFFSLFLSILGVVIIKNKAELSLIFFILASILIAFHIYLNKNLSVVYGEIDYRQKNMEKWEKLFFIFFVILISFMRFYKLNDIPPGVHGHEAIVVANCEEFDKGKFMWHMGAGAEWPTTTAYQGLFFARIFGWNIGSFRMEGAIWGVLSIIAFYFLARQLVSPISAAFASILYASNFTHLLISRNFLASPILLVSPVLGFYFLLRGIKTKKFYDFLIAGLAIGLSLHGYIPGRVIPFVFLVWLLFLLIFDKKNLPSFFNLIWLLIGFFIIAGFIIFMAIKEPAIYWDYLKSVDPNKQGSSIIGYIKTFLNYLPLHSGMFHIKADNDVSFHVANEPILDEISGVLFPLGFFISLLFFFRPIPAFFLGLLVAGMLPSMLGGGCSPQPNIRRMIVALPAIYMLSAFAFDIIFKSIERLKSKIILYISVLIIFVAGGYSIIKLGYDYFYRFTNYTPHLTQIAHHLFIAGKEIKKYTKKYEDIGIYATQYIFSNSGTVILIPKDVNYKIIKIPEEFLFGQKITNKLVFLDPFLESIKDLLIKLLPQSEFEVFKIQNRKKYQDLNSYIDPYNKNAYIIKLFIPSSSINDFHKIICKSENDIFLVNPDFVNFKEKFLNKNVELYFGFYSAKKLENIKIVIDDNYKWKIKMNNKEINTKENIVIEQGVNYFCLKGIVTEKFDLKIIYGQKNIFSPENIFAFEKPYGIKLYYMSGEKSWDKRPEIIKNALFYPKRFYDVTELPVPFCVRFEGILKPEKKSTYLFKIKSRNLCRILINDKVIFDNFENNMKEIELDNTNNYKFVADIQVNGSEVDRTFLVYYKTKNMNDWDTLPSSWIYLY